MSAAIPYVIAVAIVLMGLGFSVNVLWAVRKRRREKEDPNDPSGLVRIGDRLARENRPREAVDAYLRAARLYASQGTNLKALAAFKRVLRHDPANEEAARGKQECERTLGLS